MHFLQCEVCYIDFYEGCDTPKVSYTLGTEYQNLERSLKGHKSSQNLSNPKANPENLFKSRKLQNFTPKNNAISQKSLEYS